MRIPIRHIAYALILPLVVLVAACDDSVVDANDNDEAGAALVSVYLTDAPGDVEAVWVEVEEIYLQGGPNGRVDLLDEPTELIELTALVGITQPLLQDEEVEPGPYGQLRFVIGGAVLEAADGTVYAKDGAQHPDGLEATGQLQCPSCSQTGIKVVLQGDDLVMEEGMNDVLLDFDVTQSFGRQAGQSGMWVMRPVIHGVRMVEMGQITGTVALATDEDDEPIVSIPECPEGTARDLADFVPLAIAQNRTDDEGDPIVRTGVTAADGSFQILGLAPDDYDLGYIDEVEFTGAALEWTAEVEPTWVEVGEGDQVEGVAFTITAASCEVEDDG